MRQEAIAARSGTEPRQLSCRVEVQIVQRTSLDPAGRLVLEGSFTPIANSINCALRNNAYVRRDPECDRPYGPMILRTAPGEPIFPEAPGALSDRKDAPVAAVHHDGEQRRPNGRFLEHYSVKWGKHQFIRSYSAPSSIASQQTVTVTAISQADSTEIAADDVRARRYL